jgi:glycosyltransferase involved in cell wall biosynthesis
MQTTSPRVSIGLPVYNGSDHLAEAMESLLSQTFEDFELIICDNASTDRTPALCRHYAAQDRRVRFIQNPANIGSARNHTRTLELATGQYFKWCGHDDVHAPGYLAACVKVLDEQPAVSLAYPQTIIIDDDGAAMRNYDDFFHLVGLAPHERFYRVLAHSNQELLNPSLGLTRRSLVVRTMPLGSYYASDRVMLAQLAIDGEFYEVPERLLYRRVYQRKENWTTGSDEQVTAWFDPAAKRGIVAPRVKKLAGYFQAIVRAQQPLSVKLRCCEVFAAFYLSGDRVSGAALEARTLRHSLASRLHLRR